jgi:glycosyl transferase family 25
MQVGCRRRAVWRNFNKRGTRLEEDVVIPVLVLNLPRDIERREWMAAHLGSFRISYLLTSGVDGRAVPDHEALPYMASFRRSHGRNMTRGELGCALTYLQLFKRIACGPDPLVCVMEDDIELLPSVLPFLNESTLGRFPEFDILRLFSVEHQQHRSAWKVGTCNGRSIVVPVRAGWGTYAQVFSRHGARKLIDRPITGPIDNMVYYDRPPFGLRILEVRPSLVVRRDFGTHMSDRPRGRRWLPLGARVMGIGRDIYRPARARLHFAATWGPRGLYGLIMSRYRPPVTTLMDLR